MSKVQVHVDSLEDMGKRFVSAWKRAGVGERVDEQHVTFFNLEALLETLSPKRLALLRAVRRSPHPSVASLARHLGRDYKRVHEDVKALVTAGLLMRDDQGIHTELDELHATLSLQ
jgi:predicted transcriptional regulator